LSRRRFYASLPPIMTFKIGVDGGGTKTEAILVDAAGSVVARQLAPGCNPNVVGSDQARLVLSDALCALLGQAAGRTGEVRIEETRLYMAGNPLFWRNLAGTLTEFGRVTTAPDSLPVLELATGGQPGLVLHSGTGSFIAARGLDGRIHYAGGLGWRFGDHGSAYDLGRRAVAQALLELQGWLPVSRLAATVRNHTELGDAAEAAAVTRYFYTHATPEPRIAALAPAVLRLAEEGDGAAQALVVESVGELLALAGRVFTKLFAGVPADTVPAGLSGRILTHPVVLSVIAPRSPLPLTPVTAAPIEGVRRLLLRAAAAG
jgi:N-acetylglucosamine kinase-like BadF-type ATPase